MSRFFRNILKSVFAARKTGKFVGADQYGNRYFEKEADLKLNLRASRYIEHRNDLGDFETPTIPVEWEGWLRNKRKDPPTEEEIQRNYTRMIQTKLRAQQLEQEFRTIDSDNNESAVPVENITPESHKSPFPSYEEYESRPGYKPK